MLVKTGQDFLQTVTTELGGGACQLFLLQNSTRDNFRGESVLLAYGQSVTARV